VAIPCSGAVLGTAPLISGTASMSTQTLGPGCHSISATYSGDGAFSPAVSTATVFTVDRAPTAVTLSLVQTSSSTQITALVTSSVAGTITGNIQFFSDTILVSTVPLSPLAGVESATLTMTGATGTITSVYAGDNTFAPSTSPPLVIPVAPAPATNLVLTATPDPASAGQQVILAVTMSAYGQHHSDGIYRTL
jgi:hypothetical protein